MVSSNLNRFTSNFYLLSSPAKQVLAFIFFPISSYSFDCSTNI